MFSLEQEIELWSFCASQIKRFDLAEWGRTTFPPPILGWAAGMICFCYPLSDQQKIEFDRLLIERFPEFTPANMGSWSEKLNLEPARFMDGVATMI